MIRSQLGKTVEGLVSVLHLLVAASAIWQFLCTQNELVQV